MRNVGQVRFQCLLTVSVVLAEPKQEIHRVVEKFLVRLPIIIDLLQKSTENYINEIYLKREILQFAAQNLVFTRVKYFR